MKTFYCNCIKPFFFVFGVSFCLFANANTLPTIPSATFNVTNYGASTPLVDNASAIQQAINACNTAGGGHVIVPAGLFMCGPLTMKSNVDLQISSGAILRLLQYGTGNGTVAGSYPNTGTTDAYADFIYAKKLTNIEITGSGLIDGQGNDWWRAFEVNAAIGRPTLIAIEGCTNVAVLGISLQNSPCTHVGIGKGCDNVTIKSLTITAPPSPTSHNTDGVDTWSKNIEISNCNISTGDDNIAMDDQSDNVSVKHCTFGDGHGCSIGSYTEYINNILVDSCSFTKTSAGIRFKTARGRGGVEQNITYSNITMSGVTNPIWITSYYPKLPSSPTADIAQAVTSTTPAWQHIKIKNVTATGASNAGILWGLPEKSISDVVLDNVNITATTGMTANFVSGLTFINGSTITASNGAALNTYSTTFSGINMTTGKPVVSIVDEVINPLVKCFPNPVSNGNFYISAPSEIKNFSVVALNGCLIKQISCNPGTHDVTISELPRGIYIVDINLRDKSVARKKIIVQ